MWIGLMLPTCAAADPAGGQQATAPQATGPQAMWQQSLRPPATAAEAIPAGQPAGPAVARPPAGPAEPAGGEDDGSSWYAGTFGPNCTPAPCCEICGGGSGPPPDYYIEGGPSVLSPRQAQWSDRLISCGTRAIPGHCPRRMPWCRERRSTPSIRGFRGMLGTIGHYIGRDANDRDEFIEFSYWGLTRWQGTVTSDSNDYIFYETNSSGQVIPVLISHNLYSNFPFTIGGFNRADYSNAVGEEQSQQLRAQLSLRSRNMPDQLVLHPNGRWRRECGRDGTAPISSACGSSTSTTPRTSSAKPPYEVNNVPTPATGFYSVYTRNRLLGCQAGCEFTYRHCLWNVDVHGRAGPYLDFVGPKHDRDPCRRDRSQCAQDLNTQIASIAIRPRWSANSAAPPVTSSDPNLVGRVSYDFVWIGGVALAPEQFTSNQSRAARQQRRTPVRQRRHAGPGVHLVVAALAASQGNWTARSDGGLAAG